MAISRDESVEVVQNTDCEFENATEKKREKIKADTYSTHSKPNLRCWMTRCNGHQILSHSMSLASCLGASATSPYTPVLAQGPYPAVSFVFFLLETSFGLQFAWLITVDTCWYNSTKACGTAIVVLRVWWCRFIFGVLHVVTEVPMIIWQFTSRMPCFVGNGTSFPFTLLKGYPPSLLEFPWFLANLQVKETWRKLTSQQSVNKWLQVTDLY